MMWGGPIAVDDPIDVDGPIAVGWIRCCRVALLMWGGPIDVGWPYCCGVAL